MTSADDHERIRETEDRSWTFALLDQVRSLSTPEPDRDAALRTLAHLEDYRSIPPLTALVEDNQMAEEIRQAASDVLRGFDDITTPERRRAWWASHDSMLMAHSLRLMERSEADIVTAVASDDGHPLQSVALRAMAFGFDEPAFQPAKIRALDHRDPEVREAAADVLMWDEPVAAEAALLRALSDPSADVAAAAVDTLQYYASRRVLRVLAGMLDVADDELRATAAASFGFLQGCFESMATEGDPAVVEVLRQWMEPVRDLVSWPEEVGQRKKGGSPPSRRPRSTVSEEELLELLADPDGEWATKKATLRDVEWNALDPQAQDRLARALTAHPDPAVRDIAAAALAAWSRSADLLALTADPSFSVRKSAMYHLGLVPRDPSLAGPAWDYMTGAHGTTAYEALQTYVAHAAPAEARARLVELARADQREAVVTRAISGLVDFEAAPEVESLLPLLHDTPGVTWAAHIELLHAVRALGLPLPALDDLADVDNLYLVRSVELLRCPAS